MAYRSGLIVPIIILVASAAQAETGLASYYGGRGHRGETTRAIVVGHSAPSLRFRTLVTPYVAVLTIAGRSFAGG